ncbi:cytochrome P450 [Dactylosporangium sucinum]|uniref:Cytochrome P450 hydroxylase n=1 Tax=Dactylosporangium sucinum TaxID=1424081 RepID=A0A917WYK5_9ACTN|nr:cytochrome P450 [Dactylosporangium sucinum]GGM40915.1 cytochrome P450 hydroxylase [Dactylosporangium sucinum]
MSPPHAADRRRPHLVPADLESRPDPYPFFRQLRETGRLQPVVVAGGLEASLVTRHEDVVTGLLTRGLSRDPRNARDAFAATDGYADGREHIFERTLFSSDPPAHTVSRRLVAGAFAARNIDLLRPKVRATAEDLLDRLATRPEIDVMSDYAVPLAVAAIGDLLGIPASDRSMVSRWQRDLDVPPVDSRSAAVAFEASTAIGAYLQDLMRYRRGYPVNDLLSELAAVGRDKSLRGDVMAGAQTLLVVGHTATASLIATSIVHLVARPSGLHSVGTSPPRTAQFIEEVLRYDAPVLLGPFRYATADLQLAGSRVPSGGVVILCIASANRDPVRFGDPDSFRPDRRPNGHLTFGRGVHACLGSSLARMIAQTAVGALATRFPEARLRGEPSALRWRFSQVRCLEAVPLILVPAGAPRP